MTVSPDRIYSDNCRDIMIMWSHGGFLAVFADLPAGDAAQAGADCSSKTPGIVDGVENSC